jgi:DNA-binding NarL/FixJ family response regulator
MNPTFRNCFRCGLDFRCEENERICPSCTIFARLNRKPRSTKITVREQQVIDLVAEGKLNKEISYTLHLSEGTVKEYLHKIFRKVGVTNRTELAVWEHKKRATAIPAA